MNEWMLLAAIPVIAALGLTLGLYHMHTRRMIANIDHALDQAIAGKLDIAEFSESQTSKLEAKLARHLSSAKLRQGDLAQAQSSIRELISDISHQTKTPLSSILLSAQLLAEQPELSPDSMALVMQLDKSTGKLSFLIQSLVKLSRLENGTIAVRPVAQNLSELVNSCLEACQRDAEAKGIALTFRPPEFEISALYDFKWCTEALCNILDNAIKYTPAHGRIEVSLQAYELFACIRISDTGKGISEADLPKIFGRFYRAADSAEAPGVGIGLYLAREIVLQCGGYIQATSVPGAGSVFSVYLSKL